MTERDPSRIGIGTRRIALLLFVASVGGASLLPMAAVHAQQGTPTSGVAAKRPVLQGACDHCPWGALGNLVKKVMTSYGYDVQVCLSCSGREAARIVAKRLFPPEISDRQFAEGTLVNPNGRIDFGVTGTDAVRRAYDGTANFPEGAFRNLRIIARIENPAYLMVAVTKESGITDLKQVRERRMPVRILAGVGAMVAPVLAYYNLTPKDVEALGGAIYAGNALLKNSNFDVIIGNGVLANNPEGNMWYEMSAKKDLVFLPLPDDLRQKLAREEGAQLVEIPFRYMRGVGDKPVPTVGSSGEAVYGRDDLPPEFAYDVAKGLDEQHGLLKWAVVPFSYDPATVADGGGVPLHPGAERYYRERGYLKSEALAR
jgi:TRAP transporter TAXI family solute receptor